MIPFRIEDQYLDVFLPFCEMSNRDSDQTRGCNGYAGDPDPGIRRIVEESCSACSVILRTIQEGMSLIVVVDMVDRILRCAELSQAVSQIITGHLPQVVYTERIRGETADPEFPGKSASHFGAVRKADESAVIGVGFTVNGFTGTDQQFLR